jgi:L-cystine uptake protein TcyP (sodium:dicarboxylate symporter family)
MGMYGVIASTQMASKVRYFGGIDKVRLVAYTSRSSAAAVHGGTSSTTDHPRGPSVMEFVSVYG